jgi:CRP-like cAMP-binding protein
MVLSQHPLAKWLEQLELLAAFADEDRRAVLTLPHRVKRIDAGSYLVREGDLPKQCAVLVEGFAYRQKLTGTDSRQIMAVSIPGDAVDLQNIFLEISDHSVQLLTQATVADIPRDALQQLARARSENGFELPMTQEQLANATGLTSVHVNRVLKSLEADGLISRRRRQIHFEDWRVLQDVGDLSRRYLHIADHDIVALAAN